MLPEANSCARPPRQYPDKWSIFEEVPAGYKKLDEVNGMPSGLQLEEVYQAAYPEAKAEGLEALTRGVGSFIRNYSKG